MQSTEPETWKPIPGYEGMYEVSDLGRVRSLDRPDARGVWRRGRVLCPMWLGATKSHRGYAAVALHRGGNRDVRKVHRLVAEVFSAPGEGPFVLHGDGDTSNNALSNLRWGTPSENNEDTVAHGHHNHAGKPQCIRGHEFSELNTRVRANQSRVCRTCERDRMREVARRRRAEFYAQGLNSKGRPYATG